MTITDLAWSSDIRGRPVLELRLDGHPAYIQSSQRTELTRRGLLDGMVFLKSERSSQVPGDYITGNYAPDYEGLDLWAARMIPECSPCIRRCARPSPRTPGTQGHARRPPERAHDDGSERSWGRRCGGPT
jgi:hypothetical protein